MHSFCVRVRGRAAGGGSLPGSRRRCDWPSKPPPRSLLPVNATDDASQDELGSQLHVTTSTVECVVLVRYASGFRKSTYSSEVAKNRNEKTSFLRETSE